jgi:DNA-binding transcriptional regulator LsrR (DeoR family)
MTPRQHAIAYKVWAHCEAIGWDCTVPECADAIGEPATFVGRVVSARGWATRFRAAQADHNAYAWESSASSSCTTLLAMGFDQ